ncbi:3-ketoacyl-CoA thiolase, peroxisomal [Acipenser ruthenus]|uniref:3-ketoacyl-CoA thiolase, peroxisomal n=1 Tax=Acipenser ruthenus TaxID=7906 RepID=A0A444UM82_ACIRT|nr:3-ketoacyl-CoA thiolase, peroxisomal [Acipenser ruthenus]
MHRAKIVFGHLTQCPAAARPNSVQRAECKSFPRASPDDIVVVHGLRTAIGKAKRGAFKDTTPDELLSAVMTAVLNDVNLSPARLGDICVGNVLQPGAGALMVRVAQFLSGIPESVPIYTVNRMCSSGLQALFNVAGSIRNGSYDIGLACGVESMSLRSPGNPGDVSSRLMDNEKARDCLIPMGAEKAQKLGLFAQEIVPVSTKFVDSEGNETRITVTQDDGIRAGTTLEGLAKLRPAFKENGSTTAGNASQVSDGAAAVLVARRSAAQQLGLPVLGVLRASAVVGVPPDVMGIGPAYAIPIALQQAGNASQVSDGAAAVLVARRSAAQQLGLPVLGVLRASAVVGVPPDVMGIGPAYAIPIALQQAGLTVDDIDVFEINEAFASQALYCVEKLGIPLDKLNPSGGAIALGHPLGCTGARQVVTLLNELKRRGRRAYGVVSMCIGTGMGAAAVFEYPGQSNLQKV